MTPLQIGQLVRSLKWLTWLLSLNIVLLLIGFFFLNSSREPSFPTEPQIIDYPIHRFKSVAILTPALEKGKLLFTTNCEMCHEISEDMRVGPGLFGVTERVPDRAWLFKWIKNPSAVIKSGDVYANHMVKVSAPVLMPSFPNLKEEEIKTIIDYIASFKDSFKSEQTGHVQDSI